MRSATFLLGLALVSPAAAAKKADPKAPEPFLYRSTEPLTVQRVLGQFELFDRELRTLSARYSQSVTLARAEMGAPVEGKLSYLKPGKLRIEHAKPERQLIVTDGKDLWIHRFSQNQVIQSSLADWKQADPSINNLLQFGNYASMLRTYDVALATAGPAPVLTLRPKEKAAEPFELRLTLSPDTLFPAATELAAGEMTVRTRFDAVEYNPPLKEALFAFTPPPGADVFRNFKPPKLKP